MGRLTQCKIVFVGKRRDGNSRYWCLEHKADATLKHGGRAEKCRYSHFEMPTEDEILNLNLDDYPGGVGIWGAVPPVYDTTSEPYQRGIHVHTRQVPGGEKEFDDTFPLVRLKISGRSNGPKVITIAELDAIYYMVSSVFGLPMRYVECSSCKYPHLDKDWFSLHKHISHLCAGCGKKFSDTQWGIGNPLVIIKQILHELPQPSPPERSLVARQRDYPGGIQIWATNEAIVWTAPKVEETGIHIHAYDDNGNRVVDDTYDHVVIDDIELDSLMIRIYTAQVALPHLASSIQSINCPKCKEPLFDTDELAYAPHEEHECANCEFIFKTAKLIANPIFGYLDALKRNAIRAPQKHDMRLLPETL